MQTVTQTKTAFAGVLAPFVVYKGLTYVLYGLKTFFDVYILNAKEGNIYRCITQFGEEITVKLENGNWIDILNRQPTNTSKALGGVLAKLI